MKRQAAVLVGVLCLVAAAPQQAVTWLKLEQAKALSQRTGNAILVFVACDPGTGSASCGNGPADRAFGETCIEKRGGLFHFVRVVDKKTAQDLKATRCGEIIFLDADADEYYRSGFQDVRSLERVIEEGQHRYCSKEITWTAFDPKSTMAQTSEAKRLLLLGFSDDKRESAEGLKVLEDRQLVKYHDRFQFVRISFKKDSEESRKWGITQAPSLVIVDPAKGDILERLSGRRTVKEIKPVFAKAVGRLDTVRFEKK
jgi:hypothetical protein